MSTEPQFDLNKLIDEVTTEVNALIKSENEKLETLKKGLAADPQSRPDKGFGAITVVKGEESKEESSKEASKEESSKLKKDDEGSSYTNQAPEASAETAPAPEASAPAAPQGDEGASLQEMVSALDDQMLSELAEACQAEMANRQSAAPAGPEDSAPAPEASAPAAPAPAGLQMSEASKEMETKLAKAEEKHAELEKTVQLMADLVEKMASKPVIKAVAAVDYVGRGEDVLKKTEAKDFTVAQVDAELKKIANDPKKLETLNKRERDQMLDFFSKKVKTPEILKIITK
jgi:hypothetical protein